MEIIILILIFFYSIYFQVLTLFQREFSILLIQFPKNGNQISEFFLYSGSGLFFLQNQKHNQIVDEINKEKDEEIKSPRLFGVLVKRGCGSFNQGQVWCEVGKKYPRGQFFTIKI